jgi:hypothetical protein
MLVAPLLIKNAPMSPRGRAYSPSLQRIIQLRRDEGRERERCHGVGAGEVLRPSNRGDLYVFVANPTRREEVASFSHTSARMKATAFEPMIKSAAIRAIDGISRKLENTRVNAGGPLGRLLRRWDSLDTQEKEQFIALAITVGTAAAAAFSAMAPKRAAKKAAKSAIRKVARKLT